MNQVEQIQSMPMSIGLAIAAIVGVVGIVSAVWTVASVRKADRDDITKEISDAKNSVTNAVNRLEKKTDDNHDVLHGRVNSLMLADTNTQKEIGYLQGFLKGKFK